MRHRAPLALAFLVLVLPSSPGCSLLDRRDNRELLRSAGGTAGAVLVDTIAAAVDHRLEEQVRELKDAALDTLKADSLKAALAGGGRLVAAEDKTDPDAWIEALLGAGGVLIAGFGGRYWGQREGIGKGRAYERNDVATGRAPPIPTQGRGL